MRLFIAIQPPEGIRTELIRTQNALLAGQSRPTAQQAAGWDPKAGILLPRRSPWTATDPQQLHLTLQFLGDRHTIHSREDIRRALEGAASGQRAFDLRADRLGAFPQARSANVIWAGVQAPPLEALVGRIEAALGPLGIRRDRPFSAHITLARSRIAQDAQTLLGAMGGEPWSRTPWHVSEFCLMESQPALGGREHIVVQRYPLAD